MLTVLALGITGGYDNANQGLSRLDRSVIHRGLLSLGVEISLACENTQIALFGYLFQ